MTTEILYRSKVDGWFRTTLLLSALCCTIAVLAPGLAGAPLLSLAVSPMLLVGVGLPLWLLSSTCYLLRERELEARCGPFRWHIPLAEIHGLARTRSWLASPALSLDRIRIDYGQDRWIMVSPDDPESLLAELQRRISIQARPTAAG
ncbi:MAG TPA: PH domain-containing protein [Gammaproteobacteria bacterium]|nr:PH domain-containing protein [Gammaproteobacteria bacterium]HRP86547.1 PH domain-containing protein [Gammaproteobacteria bacterium]